MQFSNFRNRFLGSDKARISRRLFLGTSAAAGTTLGSDPLQSGELSHFGEREGPKAIPGGSGPFAPFGIFIHHFTPTVGLPLAVINEPSQITDFSGFVGNMRIRGGGIGTDTTTGATMDLAFQADIGFNQGRFIGADGRERTGTFGFV